MDCFLLVWTITLHEADVSLTPASVGARKVGAVFIKHLCFRNSSHLNMYKPYRYVRSNTGKQAISFGAIDLWKGLPDITKNLPLFSFFKQVKTYLLAKQHTY